MNKRLFLNEMRQYDLANDTCFVREIEMAVESGLKSTAYSIQFWSDVQTYGLREAVLYLKNGDHHLRLEEVITLANEILTIFGRKTL